MVSRDDAAEDAVRELSEDQMTGNPRGLPQTGRYGAVRETAPFAKPMYCVGLFTAGG
jgi:hypothetical protein